MIKEITEKTCENYEKIFSFSKYIQKFNCSKHLVKIYLNNKKILKFGSIKCWKS